MTHGMLRLLTCRLCHVLFGVATVFSADVNPVLPVVFFLTFTLYELDEEWSIGDHAFEEMREYGAGLFLGVLLKLLCL